MEDNEYHYTVKKGFFFKILFWVLGILATLSFLCGIIFQELGIFREYNKFFIAGWAVGMLGLFIAVPIYRITYVARGVIENKEAMEEVKQQWKNHRKEWKQYKLSIKIIGWIVTVLVVFVVASAIALGISGGKPIFGVMLGLCLVGTVVLGLISNAMIAKQKHDEMIAQYRAKEKAKEAARKRAGEKKSVD